VRGWACGRAQCLVLAARLLGEWPPGGRVRAAIDTSHHTDTHTQGVGLLTQRLAPHCGGAPTFGWICDARDSLGGSVGRSVVLGKHRVVCRCWGSIVSVVGAREAVCRLWVLGKQCVGLWVLGKHSVSCGCMYATGAQGMSTEGWGCSPCCTLGQTFLQPALPGVRGVCQVQRLCAPSQREPVTHAAYDLFETGRRWAWHLGHTKFD